MWGKQEGSGGVTRPAQESGLDPGPALALGPAWPLCAVVLGLLQRGKEARPRAASPAQLQSWPGDPGAPGVQLRPTPYPHLRSADGEIEAQPGAGAWPMSHNEFKAEAGPAGPTDTEACPAPSAHGQRPKCHQEQGSCRAQPGAGDPLGAPGAPCCPTTVAAHGGSLWAQPPRSRWLRFSVSLPPLGQGCRVMPVPVAPAFQHRTWQEVGAGGQGGESPRGTPPAEFLSLGPTFRGAWQGAR